MHPRSKEQVRERVRSFIKQNYMYTHTEAEVAEDDLLLKAGIIDSMGVVELIEFLQTEFDIIMEDDEITEENLGSLAAITGYVAARLVSSSADTFCGDCKTRNLIPG